MFSVSFLLLALLATVNADDQALSGNLKLLVKQIASAIRSAYKEAMKTGDASKICSGYQLVARFIDNLVTCMNDNHQNPTAVGGNSPACSTGKNYCDNTADTQAMEQAWTCLEQRVQHMFSQHDRSVDQLSKLLGPVVMCAVKGLF